MIQRLNWDSDYFDINIGKYEDSALTKQTVSDLLRQKRTDGYDLIYVFADNLAEPDCGKWIESHGGMLVDEKVIYAKQLPCECIVSPQVSEYNGAMTDVLRTLAIASGHSSRFKLDARLNHKFEDLYTLWLQKSLNKTFADKTFVYEQNQQIYGFVTVQIKDQVGQIGLIAVDVAKRGCGIGRALIAACDVWLNSQAAHRHQVVTQLQNTGACILYGKCGFSQDKIQKIYHI